MNSKFVAQRHRNFPLSTFNFPLATNHYPLTTQKGGFPITDLALSRAGFERLAAFQRANGLFPSGRLDWQTAAALRPYLTGFRLHRIRAGDTYAGLSQQSGASVRAIITANPNQDPRQLQIGAYLTLPLGFPVVATGVPFTYELLLLTVEGLRARYPFLGGYTLTRTAQGRDVPLLSVGLGPRSVLYNASHHANEWITTPLLLAFLERYCEAVSENRELFGYPAQELYQRTSLTLVPMVNPDGVDLVTGGILPGSAEYLRAQRIAASFPGIRFPDGWKANLAGVDLNLNYPAGWEEARRIKARQGYTRPAPRDYVGAAPLDQPETLALAELTRQRAPLLTLSYHTQGEVIYWKFQDRRPPRALEIGTQLAAVSGYALEDVPYSSSFAGYKDWFIQDFDRPGYTVEAGRGENPLPLEQFDEIFERNLGILTLGLALA